MAAQSETEQEARATSGGALLDGMVQESDPDRYAAARFAAPDAQRRLITLYAFNLEIARAPWRVSDPQIGAIRLAWWRDAVEEIFLGRQPRPHEVLTGLSELLHFLEPSQQGAAKFQNLLQGMITVRARDLDPAPMASRDEFDDYIEGGAGGLMRLAVWAAMGRREEAVDVIAKDLGYALGVAAMLRATPALASRRRLMLPPPRGAAEVDVQSAVRGRASPELTRSINEISDDALERLRKARSARVDAPAEAAPALLSAWRCGLVLRAGRKKGCNPFRDFGPESEFRRRASLLIRGATGRW